MVTVKHEGASSSFPIVIAAMGRGTHGTNLAGAGLAETHSLKLVDRAKSELSNF